MVRIYKIESVPYNKIEEIYTQALKELQWLYFDWIDLDLFLTSSLYSRPFQ